MRRLFYILLILANVFASISFASQFNKPISNKPILPLRAIATKSSKWLDLSQVIRSDLRLAVKDPDTGVISYTYSKYLIMKNGYFYEGKSRLQGFEAPGPITENSCKLIDIKAPEDDIPAKATTLVYKDLNLDASSGYPVLPFNMDEGDTYNFYTNETIYDGVGNKHLVSIYFIHSLLNNWKIFVSVDDKIIGSGAAEFSRNGRLLSTSGLDALSFMPNKNAPAPQIFKIDLTNSTQYAMYFVDRTDSTQDGTTVGVAVEEMVDANGYISEIYSNGVSVTFAKIAVFA